MKYLHFITRDQFYSKEFIDVIHSNFKIDEHKFIIIKEKNKKHYINPEEYQNIEIFTISLEENILKFIISHVKFFTVKLLKIRKLMEQSEYIFVHLLTEQISLILLRFRGKAKIIWILWGDDLYRYLPLKLYDDYTLELLKKIKSYNVKSFLRKIYYSFNFLVKKRVIKRIDYVNAPHKGDVILLKKYFKTKAEWYPKGIYPNPVNFEKLDAEGSYTSDEKFNFKKKGSKLLLLGNSGSKSNNHLDIMIRLSKMKAQNFNIICPLSYGPPIYIKMIIERGKMIFGDRFIPLLEFLDPYLYFQILKQVDLAVMYHNRQKGGGTVHILVYLGKPICMKKTSGYFHLIEKGVIVFSIQDLEKLILNEVEFTQAMSENNKKIATQELSTLKSAISSIERLLNLLDNRKDISGFGGNVDKKFKANY